MNIFDDEIKVCIRCVMDSSAAGITFSEDGTCVYCQNYDKNIEPYLKTNLINSKQWFGRIESQIHKERNMQEYDCLIGLSGGVDSSYLAYFVKKHLKLNPLILHVDTGWNNKIAVSNIENIVEKLDLDLQTIVIDWNEMKDLTLAFLRSQVPTIDTVQDHAIWAGMYNFARENGIKNIFTGGNLYTESVREPLMWAYHATDLRQIRDIHKKFGKMKLEKFPLIDIFTYQLFYKYYYKIKIFQPLNHINYDKRKAIEILSSELGWKDYGGKHHESNFTKFIEGYWMPSKFGIDKRKAHLSSLIHTNQITRIEANNILNSKPYNIDEIDKDFKYVASKLDITSDELKDIYSKTNKFHFDYKSKDLLLKAAVFIKRKLGSEKRIFI